MDVNAATTKAVMMKSAVMFTYILYKRTIGAEYCIERFFLPKKFLKSAELISPFGGEDNPESVNRLLCAKRDFFVTFSRACSRSAELK
jgi:hypothetical protein